MKTKIILIVVVIGCIIAGALFKGHPSAKTPVAQNIATPVPAKIQPADVPAVPEDLAIEKKAEVSLAQEKSAAQAKPQQQSTGNPAKPKEPLRDPDARTALSLVGIDPDAEAYWVSAISDTSLPDQEREDLMEDLNEDGLSDPKHPGPEDLPLIVNRLAIIEEIAPNADPFMQEHLGEAYKDLSKMLR
ncbi:MAG: hypothetical protein JF609_01855 [Verrucomicrobia bacterium]|nr:hypothetical protein [Verrucomicrobiota bacterium]